VDDLPNRIIVLNFAAIHTTSMVSKRFDIILQKTFTHAIYDLVEHPEYIAPLREEIEALLAVDGWSYSTMTKMHKLDSFLKESIRCHPLASGISAIVF
jgi:cytochrome P450